MRKIIFVVAAIISIPYLTYAQTYGSDITAGLTPTCDSQYNGSELACANVNDANQATYWGSGAGAFPHYVTFDFGSTKSPAKIGIDLTLVATCSRAFSFSLSSNGSSWSQIYSDETPNTTGVHTFEFTPTSTAYQYAKFNWTSNWGSCGTETNVTELAVYELVQATSTMSTSSVTSADVQAVTTSLTIGFSTLVFLAILVLAYKFTQKK